MRVLHLLKTSVGAAWALKQVRELVCLGVDTHVVLPDNSGNTSLYQKVGAKVHMLDMDLSLSNVYSFASRIKEFRNLVSEINPDIVHSHFYSSTLLMRLALKKYNIPRIFQVPGPLHLEHYFFRKIEIQASDENDYWIASCEWTSRKYEAILKNKNRVFLSYYGTDIQDFVSQDKSYLHHELSIPGKTKIIGMVSYMYPPKYYLGQKRGLKGHEDLIDAVALVLEKKNNVKLVFVGGEWGDNNKYEKRVMEYGEAQLGNHVVFLGTRKDVSFLYSGFDIAVHPSHSENVGGAVESLLMGVPTITSNVGGFPDLIKHKKTGLLVKPKNPADLSEKIIYYLHNNELAQRNCREGKKLTEYLFDVKRTSKEITAIYKKILKI